MRVDPLQVLTKLAAAQNIPTRRVTPPFDGLEEFDYGLRRSLDPQFDWQEFGRLLLEQIVHRVKWTLLGDRKSVV